MARLIAQTGHSFDIPSHGVTFGSDAANDVMIPAAYGVAPCHFAIWPQGDGFFVRDSGSGYGLWVNGHPVKECMLSHGDQIAAGQLQLGFEQMLQVAPRAPGPFATAAAEPLAVGANGIDPRAPRFPFAQVMNAPEPAPVMAQPIPAAAVVLSPSRQNVAVAVEPPVSRRQEVPVPPPMAQASPTPKVAPSVTEATFEVLPAWQEGKKENIPEKELQFPSDDDLIRLEPSERIRSNDAAPFPKTTPPSWLPSEKEDGSRETDKPEVLSGVTNQKSVKSHQEKVTGSHLFRAVKMGLLIALVTAASTSGKWCPPFAKNLEGFLSAVFTNESPWDKNQTVMPRIIQQQTQTLAEVNDTSPLPRLDTSKPHADVAPRFLFDGASTLFSLGFPQIEIFYLNQAQQLGLPVPKRHCTYLEKNFALKIYDLERLTSIQSDPEKPGIVVITTNKRANANEWISAAEVREESSEAIGQQQLLRYTTPKGLACGLVALDDRNFALGDPVLIRACLQRKTDTLNTPAVTAMWPDFLRKQPGAFLWTIKQDAQLQAQLNASSAGKSAALDAVSSFAVRFGGEPPHCECFAIRDPKSSQEAFTDAATSSLKSMVQMMTAQIESGGTRRSGPSEMPAIDVSRSAATVEVRRGEEFVNIFLQGFYASALADEGPLKALAQARTLAHSFNLARSMDAPESRRVRTVEEALEALQKGMSGSGRAAAMEFQVQEMDADEIRQIRKYLTFADGYLACRPDLESIAENVRVLAEEGRDRLNAETVLSLCPAPSSDRVVKIPDLASYIRKSLASLRATRGAMALFGMPQLLDEELHGVLRYITQLPNGRLGWKPGELAFNAWQAKSNPKAQRDAATLASIAGAAHAAGAKELSKVSSVQEAIELLTHGVKGDGQFKSTVFRCKDLTSNDIQAAAGLLVLEQGQLKLKESEMAGN